MKKLFLILGMLLSLSLVAAACGSDSDTVTDAGTDSGTDSDTDEPSDSDGSSDALGDGSLGTVIVEPGEEVQIRSLNAITGEVAFLGVPNQRGIEMAVADYGDIKGFAVTSGTGLDDLCSAEGGQAAAQQIVADEQIVGVIGTSCSGAAAAASPLISDNGYVMISGSNTSPTLTSDTAGNASENFQVGYFRTAHNDVFQGAAMAEYAYNELGLRAVGAVHDGDPYTFGLSEAFGAAFEELGGDFTAITAIAKGDTDMVPVLTEIAATSPDGLFAPLFQPESDFLFEQVRTVSGMEDVTLLSADASLNTNFMALEQSRDIHFSGPDTRFGENVNESTGRSAADVLAQYEEDFGEVPSAVFWAHSYDATAMLLDAIDAASSIDDDGNLVIDRAGVREYLYALDGYSALIGTIGCDEFGDCGSTKVTIVHHTDPSDPEGGLENVVFEYS